MYFILDQVRQEPHGNIEIAGIPQDDYVPYKPIENLVGHFNNFTYDNWFHIDKVNILPVDAKKFIFTYIHMPLENRPNLSKQAVDMLVKDGNTFLVLFTPWEYIITAKELAAELDDLGIPKYKVIVLCSNIENDGKSLYGSTYICINFWESYTRQHHKFLPDVSITSPRELEKSLPRATRKFLSLNRNVKAHRIWWMYAMIRNKIIDQGHVSYHLPSVHTKDYYEISRSHLVLKYIPEAMHTDYKMALLREMYARSLDPLDKKHIINYGKGIKHYYNDSLFSIVTESDHRANFLTEKTFKAIANLHPFFIIGNPDQHAVLRARGYHTFEDFFETDCVMNYLQAEKLCKNIDKMLIRETKQKIQKNYLDKLVHNQQLFFNRKADWNLIVDRIANSVNRNQFD